jgi:hypothetical protein
MNTAKPYIKPETIAAAHRIAAETTANLRWLGCTVEVTSDDNGLPVMTYTTPLTHDSVVVRIEVREPPEGADPQVNKLQPDS